MKLEIEVEIPDNAFPLMVTVDYRYKGSKDYGVKEIHEFNNKGDKWTITD